MRGSDASGQMQDFERVFMRALRHIYDTEMQLITSVRMLAGTSPDTALVGVLETIEQQSSSQVERLESIFRTLYLEPRAEASWATTALLREAWDCTQASASGTQGCAAALLAIKRYEITLYESLLRWSEQCHLDEALPDIRRSIAEELVQASILSELAFKPAAYDATALGFSERPSLH